MNKRHVIAILAILTISSALYAGGAREVAEGKLRNGSVPSDVKEVTVTGELELTSQEVLVHDGENSYSLSARGGQWLDLEAQDGAVVTLTGIVMEDAECDEDIDGHLFVSSAVVGGQSYSFDMGNSREMLGYGIQSQKSGRMGSGGYQQQSMPGRGYAEQIQPRGGNTRQSQSYGSNGSNGKGGYQQQSMPGRGYAEQVQPRGSQGRYL